MFSSRIKHKNPFCLQPLNHRRPRTALLVVGALAMACLTLNAIENDSEFNLKVDGKTALLKNRFFVLNVTGLVLRLSPKHGKKHAIAACVRGDAIKEISLKTLEDSKTTKRIELMTKPFSRKNVKCFNWNMKRNVIFHTRLSITKESPVITVESALRNLSDGPVGGYFSWAIRPAYSLAYYSKGQFMVDSPGRLDVEDWAYFPNGIGEPGIGVILEDPKTCFMRTCYPAPTWEKGGWFICVERGDIEKNKNRNMNFKLIPSETLGRFNSLREKEMTKGEKPLPRKENGAHNHE